MSITPKHNPVTRRIEQLRLHYKAFHSNEKAKLCCWLLETDERQVLDEFYNMECSAFGEIPDLIVRFETPFIKGKNFGQELVQELSDKVKGYKEELGEESVPINWTPQNYGGSDQEYLLKNLDAFGQSLEDLDDAVVAFLQPVEIRSTTGLTAWLEEALLTSRAGNKVRFMIVDDADSPAFGGLANSLPEAVMVFKPELDMPQAMKEIASAAGGPNNPGVKFQHAFTDLSEAIGKSQFDKAEKIADTALGIAASNNWIHLQVAVHLAMGSGWVTGKNLPKAISNLDEAKKLADIATKEENPLGPPLAVNALFFKGSALVSAKDYQAAAAVYRAAVPASQTAKDIFKEMEAWRMSAFCAEQTSDWKDAYDYYEQALLVAEKLDDGIRQNSTVPFIGAAWIKINDREFGDVEKGDQVASKMITWLGEDWQQKIPK
ncbi:MAG: hypothetical protein IPN76_26360 [Saprospiraceae bacterium]|nr:hypothetical protein [Saprospiraceae bacterium]